MQTNKFTFKSVEEHMERMMDTLPENTVCSLYEHHLLNLALETMPYMPELLEQEAVNPLTELARHTEYVVKLIERVRPISDEVQIFVEHVKLCFKTLSIRQNIQNN
jgi:hypothetical protein